MTNQPLNSGEQGKLLIFTLLFAPSVFLGVGAIPAIFLGLGLFMMKKNEDFSSVEIAVKYFKVYVWIPIIGSVLISFYFGISVFSCVESRLDDKSYKGYESCRAAIDDDKRVLGVDDTRGLSGDEYLRQLIERGYISDAKKAAALEACTSEKKVAEKAEADAWAGSLAGKLNMRRYCWSSDKNKFFISMFLAALSFAYLILVQVLFLNPLKSHREWVVVNGIFSSKPKSAMQSSTGAEMSIMNAEKLKQYSVADELLKLAKLKEDGHITEEEFSEARKKLLKRS